MARYVEIDDVEVSDYVTVWDCNCSEFGRQTVMAVDDLQYLPTADVVPKSEVERLENTYSRAVRKADKKAIVAIQNAKQEVAREIFEEIEKKVKASITVHLEEINKEHIIDTPLYDRHSGIVFALRRVEDFIAELKKKYTEVDDAGK